MLGLHRPNCRAPGFHLALPLRASPPPWGARTVGSERLPHFGRKSIAKVLLHQDLHAGRPADTAAIRHKILPNLSQARSWVNRAKLQFVLFFTKFFPPPPTSDPFGDGTNPTFDVPGKTPDGNCRAAAEELSVVGFRGESYIDPFGSAKVVDQDSAAGRSESPIGERVKGRGDRGVTRDPDSYSVFSEGKRRETPS